MCVKKKYIPVDEHTLFYYNIMCNNQNYETSLYFPGYFDRTPAHMAYQWPL